MKPKDLGDIKVTIPLQQQCLFDALQVDRWWFIARRMTLTDDFPKSVFRGG